MHTAGERLYEDGLPLLKNVSVSPTGAEYGTQV